jgi:putative alpha-1,2-mannosidase
MAIENVQQLLTEQLGKGTTEIFTTAEQTSKDYYAVHFPVTSVISAITVANATGESALQTTMPAGTVLYMNITAITLTSGIGIAYVE